jgi:peptidoglycan hydrolase CwlO-like protein
MSAKVIIFLFIVMLVVIVALGWTALARANRASVALETAMEAISELEQNQQILMDAVGASDEELEELRRELDEARDRIRQLIEEAEEALTPPEPEPIEDPPVNDMPPPQDPGMDPGW